MPKLPTPASNPSVPEPPFFMAFRSHNPNGPVTVHIDPARIENADVAGIMLADFAKHMARALRMTGTSRNEQQTLRAIRAMFDAELDRPTQDVSGRLKS
jgi:Domain of unknown function (DUF5076)